MPIWVYIPPGMARAATTADAFNAVAEPRRRQILDALAGGERPVNDLVRALGLAQPQVSKHLRVLREVGAVDVRVGGMWRYSRSSLAWCWSSAPPTYSSTACSVSVIGWESRRSC